MFTQRPNVGRRPYSSACEALAVWRRTYRSTLGLHGLGFPLELGLRFILWLCLQCLYLHPCSVTSIFHNHRNIIIFQSQKPTLYMFSKLIIHQHQICWDPYHFRKLANRQKAKGKCGRGYISMDCSTQRGASRIGTGATTLPRLYR